MGLSRMICAIGSDKFKMASCKTEVPISKLVRWTRHKTPLAFTMFSRFSYPIGLSINLFMYDVTGNWSKMAYFKPVSIISYYSARPILIWVTPIACSMCFLLLSKNRHPCIPNNKANETIWQLKSIVVRFLTLSKSYINLHYTLYTQHHTPLLSVLSSNSAANHHLCADDALISLIILSFGFLSILLTFKKL